MTIPLDMPARAVAFSNGGNVLAVACDGHGSDKVSSLVLFEHLYMETMIEALCMSLNPRLGMNSPMAVLDGSADVLEHIFKLSGKRRLTRLSGAEGHKDRMLSICFGPDDLTIFIRRLHSLPFVQIKTPPSKQRCESEESNFVGAQPLVGPVPSWIFLCIHCSHESIVEHHMPNACLVLSLNADNQFSISPHPRTKMKIRHDARAACRRGW